MRPLFVYFGRVCCASASVCKAVFFNVFLNVLLLRMSFCILHLKQSYFCHLLLYIYIPRDIFVILFFLHLSPYISPSTEVTLTSVRKGGIDSRGPWTISQGLFQEDEGGLSRNPWYQDEVSSMCGFVSIKCLFKKFKHIL
jgi:hypothetical protein